MNDEDSDNAMEVDPPPSLGKNGKKLSRGEKSRIAAKCRRDKENVAMNELIRELPVNDETLRKMDKSSVIKLAVCYIKMKHFLQKDMVAYDRKKLPPPRPPKLAEPKMENDQDWSDFPCPDGEGQMMLDALNGFLIFVSRKGTIKFISTSVTDHIGLHQENLIGKNISEIIHPSDIQELTKQFTGEGNNKAKAITDGSNAPACDDHGQKVFYLRMKYVHRGQGKLKGSGYILVQWTGKLKTHVSNKSGQVATDGLVSVCRPMQTSSVVEIRLDGSMFMSRHDLGMTFTFCDTRIITLIGYEPDEVVGRTAYHFHNPVDAPKVSDCHQNLIVKGSSVSKYYRFLGKNDNWVWLQTRATIIYNTNNKPQYIVCMNYVISEEEGERYLMLEEHKHANSCLDNTCLTLPDNHVTLATTPTPGCCPTPSSTASTPGPRIVELPPEDNSGCDGNGNGAHNGAQRACIAPAKLHHDPCIEELKEENLTKTACLNGELDQPQLSQHAPPAQTSSVSQCLSEANSVVGDGYLPPSLSPGAGYQPVVSGYQQQAGSPLGVPQFHQAGAQQQFSQPGGAVSDLLGQEGSLVSPSVADSLSQSPAEGSPDSTTSTLSPCPEQDQYSYTGGVDHAGGIDHASGVGPGTVSLLRDTQSYSEDGGYESATSPYSASYLSPQILSPGSHTSDTGARSEAGCGFSEGAVRGDAGAPVPNGAGGFSVGYSETGACGSGGVLQGDNSRMLSSAETSELRETENILEALLEGFDGQAPAGNLDVTIAAICSTIENLTNQNAPLVSTRVKSPGCGVQKRRVSPPAAARKQKDKSLLRSFLTMPEDDIPKHSLTFLKKAKSQNAALGSESCGEGQMDCGSAQNSVMNATPLSGKNGRVTHVNGFQEGSCPARNSVDTSDVLDLQEMPQDITDFALQYLDTLTEAQTQAVIADLSSETLMDTSENDFKKDLFNTIDSPSPDTEFYSSSSVAPSQTSYSQSLNSPVCSKQRSFGHSQTLAATTACTSYQGLTARPSTSSTPSLPSSSSSSHDHVYHQSKFGGTAINNRQQTVRSHTHTHPHTSAAAACTCSTPQSQYTQTTRLCNSSHSTNSQISELERHLLEAAEAGQHGLLCNGDGMGAPGRPFLRQLLTGELTKDKYMQMERERCGYSHKIRPQ